MCNSLQISTTLLYFYDYFAECEIGVQRASANSLAGSIGRSVDLLFVFPLTNAQLDLTKRKMSSNGSANVKHSEAMSDEIVTAMSTACSASMFVFELFKKNLESICCPSYEMNAGSWQAGFFLS